ncbi:MAG: hypothetical protein NZM43_04240 [Saprospiraceae bacterium]|nr:hypothetical protein [Saprospiraceae bacterium]MDW8483517.1 hypothetical protein [Saprospiraceae bacterium]
MRWIFLLLWNFISIVIACAQDDANGDALHPCGTPPGVDPWLRRYLEGLIKVPDSDDTLWVGMQIHLLARNDGTGRFGPDRLLDAFYRLNEDFAQTGIRFYFKHAWNLLNNSAWFEHDSIVQGRAMMFANNVSDALNVYFVQRAAGNCGYNLPYAGIAMAHACSGPNGHTWAHEVGHALALPHPFLGWEGKVYNPDLPTPDTLLYDYTHFHAEPDTIVPAPLDTALVEYVDGSNCSIAADRICDTGPDYLSYRWSCNAQGLSNVQQRDPAGKPFFSDGTLFMSYAADNCQRRFTPQQIQIMRARLRTDRSRWVAPSMPVSGLVSEPALLVAPINSVPSPVNATILHWRSVPNATHYLVQVSKVGSFGVRDFEAIVSDTFVLVQNISPNWNYFWRVRAFNAASVGPYSASGRFLSTSASTVNAAHEGGWRIFPTFLPQGTPLAVEAPESWRQQPIVLSVFDTGGRLLFQQELTLLSSRDWLFLPTEKWPTGPYVLVCTSKLGVVRQSFWLVAP